MNKSHIFLLLFIVLCASCAPKGGLQSLAVPEIPDMVVYPQGGERPYKSYVYVNEFGDARPSPFFVKYGATAFEPASNIGPVVRDRLARTLEKKNFVISNNAPIVVSGQVRAWEVKVGDQVGGMQAEAELTIEVMDRTGSRMFSGVYRGLSNYSKIELKDKTLSRALSRAMGEAVKQLFADQDLMRILSSS